ncbi:hypothetical protein [Phytohabitans aurantiacus]|uniref:DUF5642 domain-containing protein n=1 Tax=Phytohabitans aurantiacus TaxID=3016789 RepID=A0ABQ5QW09_9ACTN|nr:hypothetical protein [Phytohabitans aurantiacus]GLH98212.1 hypothetical protein Pa4123_34870 [Phytohabitans aurantiacus]
MSDNLSTLFEQMHGAQPPAPFASPDQLRRRARQRSRRQALAAACTVLAVAGAGACWAALRPSAAPPPRPGASVSPPAAVPTAVPQSALLRVPDFSFTQVEAGELDDQGPDGPDWPISTIVSGCPDYRESNYQTPAQRRAARAATYLGPDGWNAWQIVELYPDASANILDISRVLITCRGFSVPDGADIKLSVTDRGFAGDNSLLISQLSGNRITYIVVVRVGYFVSTLSLSGDDENQARTLAKTMATRLRT